MAKRDKSLDTPNSTVVGTVRTYKTDTKAAVKEAATTTTTTTTTSSKKK